MTSDPNCIFCKIINKSIPSKIIHEDELAIAFDDIHPQAPIHTLIIPKKHIVNIIDINDSDRELIGHLFLIAKNVATKRNLDKSGFRLIINNGAGAGQSVFHIHVHLLAGRRFSWPPG